MKVCAVCHVKKPFSKFHKQSKAGDGYQRECKQCFSSRNKHHIIECRKLGRLTYQQRTRARLKLEVLAQYSKGEPKCECCKEKHVEFLAIDHINGGGIKHRATIGNRKGTGFYYWLKKNGYPNGYRVLCHNCNQCIGYYGYCPHQKRSSRFRIPKVYKKPLKMYCKKGHKLTPDNIVPNSPGHRTCLKCSREYHREYMRHYNHPGR